MFKKEQRITKDREFKEVFKGKGHGDAALNVKIAPNDLKYNRYGVVISTKISKKATRRNYLKRQIRAALSGNENKIKKGFDIVVIGRSELRDFKRKEIATSLSRHLSALELY